MAVQLLHGRGEGGASRLLRDAWSLELLARYTACGVAPRQAPPTRAERDAIEHARTLLLRNLASAPKLDELAAACGLSVYRMNRGFRAIYGQSVHALYQRERMAAAWRLIESSAMDVGSAGEQVGYSNLSHFSDNFRRHHGILPSELKRCAAGSLRAASPQ